MTITNLRALRHTLDIGVFKASCFGNSFLIYDATEEPTLDETWFPEFARQVTDPQFGVGADNFLVVQNNTEADFLLINQARSYWKKLPRIDADYVFRMFEPDGAEALCCGNGLMCIASYLAEKHRVPAASIATEIPLARINRTTIGYSRDKSYGWVNLGHPRRLPAEVGAGYAVETGPAEVQVIDELRVRFRNHDLQPYSAATELRLSGYLTFTGEPHLVFLLDDDDGPLGEFAEAMFATEEASRGAGSPPERRSGFGTWLVDHVGHYLNTHCRDRFPAGINVNFARAKPGGDTVEYRCYERGVFKETLACGTGAVAVAFIMKHCREFPHRGIKILPHRCRWYKPEAIMAVRGEDNGWVLEGQPDLIAEIDFRFEPPRDIADSLPRRQASLR